MPKGIYVRTKKQVSRLDSMLKSIKKWTENVTYGEMQDIAKDKRKLDLIEQLYKELSSLLNDIDIMTNGEKNG